MKTNHYIKKLANKELNSDELNDFQVVLIEILDDTFKKKKIIHNNYYDLVQKLWLSEKSIGRKVMLAKYLLNRLNLESSRILWKASVLASRLCPHCKNADLRMKKLLEQNGPSRSYH